MKVFKILQKIFMVVALAAFLASFIIAAVNLEGDAAYLAVVSANVGVFAAAAVGVFLLSSSNDVAKRVGHGLTLAAFAAGLALAIMTFGEYSIAPILVIVAVAALALYYLSVLIIFIMKKSSPDSIENPNDDARVVCIREWKHIMEEGIISPEEYEEKRQQILGLKTKDAKDAKANRSALEK